MVRGSWFLQSLSGRIGNIDARHSPCHFRAGRADIQGSAGRIMAYSTQSSIGTVSAAEWALVIWIPTPAVDIVNQHERLFGGFEGIVLFFREFTRRIVWFPLRVEGCARTRTQACAPPGIVREGNVEAEFSGHCVAKTAGIGLLQRMPRKNLHVLVVNFDVQIRFVIGDVSANGFNFFVDRHSILSYAMSISTCNWLRASR